VSGACTTPPAFTPYTAAVFTRDYSASCRPDQRLVWRFFDWKAAFPASPGSSIMFSAASAATQAGLATATPVALGTQTTTNTSFVGGDVSAAFDAAVPKVAHAAWLRVFMVFTPTTDTKGTPYLTDWRQAYNCVDAE
jgi:hypothetical protein